MLDENGTRISKERRVSLAAEDIFMAVTNASRMPESKPTVFQLVIELA